MRNRSLLALGLALASIGTPPAGAASVRCKLQGNAGQFAVRKVVNPGYNNIAFNLKRTWPGQLQASDGENHHLFTGMWLLRASDFLDMSSAFWDHTTNLGLGGAMVSYDGLQLIDQRLPSSNVLVDGDQGEYGYASRLDPGTYYFIGFADGAGTFEMTLGVDDWQGAITCEEMPWVEGRIVSYTALDFKGGTQIVGPGYGHAQNATLSFTNPYPCSIGAVFAYEPPPAPPASMRVSTEYGSRTFSNDMGTTSGCSAELWNLTANYTGKTNTILIELLQTNLAPTG